MTTVFLTVAQFFVFLGFSIMIFIGLSQIVASFLPKKNKCVN